MQDIVDPKIQHHLGCTLAECVTRSPAIRIEHLDVYHPSVRATAQTFWDSIRPGMQAVDRVPPPYVVPTIRQFSKGVVTPALFTKPISLKIPKNSYVKFGNTDLFEVRFGFRENSAWSAVGTVVSMMDMDVLIRPVAAAVSAETERTTDKEPAEQEVVLWIEVGLDCNFGELMPAA